MSVKKGGPPSPPPPPLILEMTQQYARDLKRLSKKRAGDMPKLRAVIAALQNRIPLPSSHKEHSLKGDWAGFLECHVGGEGDWLLIYHRTATRIRLVRTGSHDDLFR
jgi:mRNA interferase YafQ